MDPGFYDYDEGITALDALYERPRLNAIHVVVERGRAAIVDTGTAHAVPRVLRPSITRAGPASSWRNARTPCSPCTRAGRAT